MVNVSSRVEHLSHTVDGPSRRTCTSARSPEVAGLVAFTLSPAFQPSPARIVVPHHTHSVQCVFVCVFVLNITLVIQLLLLYFITLYTCVPHSTVIVTVIPHEQ